MTDEANEPTVEEIARKVTKLDRERVEEIVHDVMRELDRERHHRWWKNPETMAALVAALASLGGTVSDYLPQHTGPSAQPPLPTEKTTTTGFAFVRTPDGRILVQGPGRVSRAELDKFASEQHAVSERHDQGPHTTRWLEVTPRARKWASTRLSELGKLPTAEDTVAFVRWLDQEPDRERRFYEDPDLITEWREMRVPELAGPAPQDDPTGA